MRDLAGAAESPGTELGCLLSWWGSYTLPARSATQIVFLMLIFETSRGKKPTNPQTIKKLSNLMFSPCLTGKLSGIILGNFSLLSTSSLPNRLTCFPPPFPHNPQIPQDPRSEKSNVQLLAAMGPVTSRDSTLIIAASLVVRTKTGSLPRVSTWWDHKPCSSYPEALFPRGIFILNG